MRCAFSEKGNKQRSNAIERYAQLFVQEAEFARPFWISTKMTSANMDLLPRCTAHVSAEPADGVLEAEANTKPISALPSVGLVDMPPELIETIARYLGHLRNLASARIACRPFANVSPQYVFDVAVRWGSRHPAALLASGAPHAIVRAALAQPTIPLGPWLLKHAAQGGCLASMRHLCALLSVRLPFSLR